MIKVGPERRQTGGQPAGGSRRVLQRAHWKLVGSESLFVSALSLSLYCAPRLASLRARLVSGLAAGHWLSLASCCKTEREREAAGWRARVAPVRVRPPPCGARRPSVGAHENDGTGAEEPKSAPQLVHQSMTRSRWCTLKSELNGPERSLWARGTNTLHKAGRRPAGLACGAACGRASKARHWATRSINEHT